MAIRFGREARRVVHRSRDEARERGSRTVEAEDLMLSLTEQRAGVARECLVDAGLDREGILRALEEEAARSLAGAGVSRDAFDLPPPRPSPSTPRWGASARLALERTAKAALARGDRSIEGEHVLLGILAAERGTVPRALAAAGVDRARLIASVEEAMAARA
jgi:ATP-dependent Clp protease ATP-binding subunit ClpA